MKYYFKIVAVVMTAMIITAFTSINLQKEKEEKTSSSIPIMMIESLAGEAVSTKDIVKSNESTLLVFWATCCAPCKQELTTISNVYNSWQKETGVNVVAVSVDLPQYANGVEPFVNKAGWDFDVYLDVKRNLMHAMSASSTPHSFLINKAGEVVWEKSGFVSGDEVAIYQQIKNM